MDAENFHMDVMQVDTELGNKTLTSPEVESYSNTDEYQNHCERTCLGKDYILDLLSRTYAELLVTLAVIAVFIEILHGPIPLFRIHVHFYVYLLGLSTFIFILGFTSRLIHRFNRKDSLKCNSEALKKSDRIHNITKYFQFGLLVSGLAVFYHSCLRSAALFMSPEKCVNSYSYVLYLIHTIFVALQVAFLQTNFNKLQRIFGCFQRIFIMHLIATNASLCLYGVLWESSTDWQMAVHDKHNSSVSWGQKDINISLHSLEFGFGSDNQSWQLPKHAVHVTSHCWWREPDFEVSEDILSIQLCLRNSSFGMLWGQTSKYSYPIGILYYIVAIFLLCIICRNKSLYKYQCFRLQSVGVKRIWLNFVLTRGSFFGCVLFTASIIVAVYEIFSSIHFVYILIVLCIVFGLGACVSLLGLLHIKSIHVSSTYLNKSMINSYLRYGILFVYVFGVCNLFVGCLSEKSYGFLLSIQACLMIFHAVLQYIFINKITTMPMHSLVKVKFQQGIIFLILCNASLWVLECFTFLNSSQTDVQIEIFGFIAWSIILRIIIPFLAFYRFYSAVLLLDSWKFMHVKLSDI